MRFEVAPAIEIEGLGCRLGNRRVLHEVTFSVMRGTCTALVGANGAGKTSLLRCILGLQRSEGSIRLHGSELRRLSVKERARLMAYVPQRVDAASQLTSREFVELALYSRRGFFESRSPQGQKEVESALCRLGLSDYSDAALSELSQGERQRLLVAAALCQDTPLMLLDEPTAYLDPTADQQLYSLLNELKRNGRTLLIVSHDLNRAALFADSIVALKNGRVSFSGSSKDFMTEQVLNDIYGGAFYLLPHPSADLSMIVPK